MKNRIEISRVAVIGATVTVVWLNPVAFAQSPQLVESFKETPVSAGSASSEAVLPHFRDGRFWVSGQNLTAYARYGWNDGKTESFAYTEIDSTVSEVVGANGQQWDRAKDRAGMAFSSNAISRAHQNYLADGGPGFIIGDGALRYGRENILETYYTVHLWRGVYVAPDLQYVRDPAYNRDRGPVIVPGFRLHLHL